MVHALLGGFVVAAFVGYLIVRYPGIHARLSVDVPSAGPQKFHRTPTPRIGGIAILVGLAVSVLLLQDRLSLASVALICGLFAFCGGLAEDLTKRVGVRFRLLLTFISAALAYFLLDGRIAELDVPGLDWALSFTLISFVFTVFAVGGLAHAFNIVDGFNGLAGVVALIFLGAIAYVAASVNDAQLMWTSLTLGVVLLGFLFYNYPRGLIFLGDGGAYLVGFLVAELAVLLVHRNSEVSPWFAFTLFSYPVVETFFSMYRKRVLRDQSPGDPDGVHLHMLIHKRLVRRLGRAQDDVWANSLTSPYLWVFAALGAVPAAVFWNQTGMLELAALAFAMLYVWLYWRIVRFRVPKFLLIRRQRGKASTPAFGQESI